MFLAGGPFGLGPLELFLIVVVLLLVFGVGKIADLGSSLGTGIREFRRNIKDDAPEAPSAPASLATAAPPISGPAATPMATAGASENGAPTVAAVKCPNC